MDFSYDIIGVVFSVLFFIQKGTSSTKITFFVLSMFICLSGYIPLSKVHLWWTINQSPVLLNFERPWEDQIFSLDKNVKLQKISATKLFNTKGHAGKLTIHTADTYAGFSLNHAKSDWSQYSTLSWEMVSLFDEPVLLNLRIHDSVHNQEYSDRFNDQITVVPGFNSFEIALSDIKAAPESREMMMEDISYIKFFLNQTQRNTTLYIDNIQLQ